MDVACPWPSVFRPGAKAASTVVFARRENPALLPRPTLRVGPSPCRSASRIALPQTPRVEAGSGWSRETSRLTHKNITFEFSHRPSATVLEPAGEAFPAPLAAAPGASVRCRIGSSHRCVLSQKGVVLRVPRTQRRDADSSLNDIPCRDSQQQQQSTQSELVATRFTAYSTAEPKSQTTQSPKLAAEPLVPCSALGRDVIDVR